jgi:putative copper resistance protein D
MSSALPAFGFDRFGTIQLEAVPTLAIAVVVVLYVVGVRRVRRSGADRWSMKRTVAFLLGAAIVLVAVDSVIGVYDDVLFADHMTQHLLLVMVAAPLLAMGAPIELATRTIRGRIGNGIRRALNSHLARVVGHPIFGFALFAAVIPVAHLTALYNVTLTNEPVHYAEHLSFLVIGYLFWRPVVGIEPTRHPLSPGLRLLYLVLALPIEAFTGVTLASATHELFPAYFSVPRPWGPSLVGDLHDGGREMYIGGDALMLVAMVPVAVQWARQDYEGDAGDLSHPLDG